MTDFTLNRISSLRTEVRLPATWLIWVLRTYYGLPAVITEGARSQSRQDYLYAQGRTRPGPIITHARVSDHTTGLAFDIDMYGHVADTVPGWIWDTAGAWGEYLGLGWGGRFMSINDQRHFFLETV